MTLEPGTSTARQGGAQLYLVVEAQDEAAAP
jgi:hypothetical protein